MKNSWRALWLSVSLISFISFCPASQQEQPVYVNSTWKEALLSAFPLTKNHIIGLGINYAVTKYGLSKLAPSIFINPTYQHLAASIGIFYALSTLALRFKKPLMKRFEEESSYQWGISLASDFLPALSFKTQALTALGAVCYLWNEKNV